MACSADGVQNIGTVLYSLRYYSQFIMT